MNTSVRFDFLLNQTANNAAASKPTQSKAGVEFKQQYEKQLQTPNKQVKSSTNKPSVTTADTKKDTKVTENASYAVDRNNRSDPNAALVDQKSAVNGENLPIPEEARKFLAALPAEDQEQVLEEVRQWLVSLSPEELNNLQQQLVENPDQLLSQLPQELQELLAKIQGVDLDELLVPEGFTELLAGLLSADIDFQRVAAIQMQPGALAEVRMVANATLSSNESLSTQNNVLATNATQEKVEIVPESKQQAKDSNTKNEEKLSELVSSLGKASAQGVARAGGEALTQLLQAAGMGVANTQAAGAGTQTVARMAAGFSSMPLMMQAAAESNAQALASRISMMNAKNLQVAEMRLDPPNLGSVKIQIRMQGDQASIIFQAPNAHARELLEQSLPKLREMMESEGLMLADAQVSEESFSGQNQEQDGSAQYAGNGAAGDDEMSETKQIPLLTQPLGLIDYYA